MESIKTEVLSFDIDECNSRECQVHNHGFYLGEQSKQAEVEELQKKIDLALEKCYTGIRKQGGDYYLELIQDVLKGEETK